MTNYVNRIRGIKLAHVLLGAGIAIALIAAHGTPAGDEPISMASDWSHRHLLFSTPKSFLQAMAFSSEPRYVHQWIRRYAERKEDLRFWRGHNTPEDLLKGDWNVFLGNIGTVGAGHYPAKYSFNVTSANCASASQPDFVVYNTSLSGSSSAVAAFDTGAFSATAAANSTVTIKNGASTLILTATGTNAHTGAAGSGTGTFNQGANATASATGLAASINIANNGSFVGVSATSSGAVVTITATTAGTAGNAITVAAGTSPASNLALTFATLVNGAAGVPTIVALDNLYTGCTGTVPSTYWAYNTGGSAAVVTSPALSGDGKQVAFVQSATGVGATLVLLKWAASSGTVLAPVTLTAVSNATYRACSAPCMTTIAFSGGTTHVDTNSSPFYDFAHGSDTLYVGDDVGSLHKFTGVFSGTPAEATTNGWPVAVSANKLTSPVYDSGSGKVFVADGNSGTNTGALYSIVPTANPPTLVASAQLSYGTGIVDSPIVDSAAGKVYVSSADNMTCMSGPPTNSAVIQMPVGFAASAGPAATALVGNCNITGTLYAGDFDNAYYTGAGNTGNMYVCGNSGAANTTTPTLYQISMSAATFGSTVNQGPALAANGNACSSVTEVYNPNAAGGAKDWIFTSVTGGAVNNGVINCPSSSSGCVMSFDVTSGATVTGSTPTVGRASVAGGASGIVLDNTVGSGTLAGASQVYFTPLATGNCTTSTGQGIGGCAVQASQSALN